MVSGGVGGPGCRDARGDTADGSVNKRADHVRPAATRPDSDDASGGVPRAVTLLETPRTFREPSPWVTLGRGPELPRPREKHGQVSFSFQ